MPPGLTVYTLTVKYLKPVFRQKWTYCIIKDHREADEAVNVPNGQDKIL